MKQDKLSRRLKEIVLTTTTEYRRFKQLEDLTGVPADSWKSWFHGRQRPTAEMMEALARAWPEYAFWLTTGISDSDYGHVAPGNEGFPKRSKRKENSANYFRAALRLKDETMKVALAYFEAEEIPDLEPNDNLMALGAAVVLDGGQEITQNINKSDVVAAKQAHDLTLKLRRAEILVETEMPIISYDATESLISTVEQLLSKVPDSAKAKLERILNEEKERLARHKQWESAKSQLTHEDNK